MNVTQPIASLTAALLLLVGFAAASAVVAADVEYGEYLSSECVTCHRPDGQETNIPDITGWDPESFIAVLRAYKTKERENKVMQTIAGALTDEDMKSLAAYFATLESRTAKSD